MVVSAVSAKYASIRRIIEPTITCWRRIGCFWGWQWHWHLGSKKQFHVHDSFLQEQLPLAERWRKHSNPAVVSRPLQLKSAFSIELVRSKRTKIWNNLRSTIDASLSNGSPTEDPRTANVDASATATTALKLQWVWSNTSVLWSRNKQQQHFEQHSAPNYASRCSSPQLGSRKDSNANLWWWFSNLSKHNWCPSRILCQPALYAGTTHTLYEVWSHWSSFSNKPSFLYDESIVLRTSTSKICSSSSPY